MSDIPRLIIPNDDLFRDHYRIPKKVPSRNVLARLLAPRHVAHAMAGLVDAGEQDVLEDWFRGTTPSNLDGDFLALFTTSPDDAGSGSVEPTWTPYARITYTRNATNWGSSVAGAPSTIQNLTIATFATVTAGSGTVVSWGYKNLASPAGGQVIFWAALTASKLIDSTAPNDVPFFAAGDLIAQLGDPGDTF